MEFLKGVGTAALLDVGSGPGNVAKSIINAKRKEESDAKLANAIVGFVGNVQEQLERYERRIKELENIIKQMKEHIKADADFIVTYRNSFSMVYAKYAAIKAMKDKVLAMAAQDPANVGQWLKDNKDELIHIGRQAEYEFLLTERNWPVEIADRHMVEAPQKAYWNRETDLEAAIEESGVVQKYVYPEPAGGEEVTVKIEPPSRPKP